MLYAEYGMGLQSKCPTTQRSVILPKLGCIVPATHQTRPSPTLSMPVRLPRPLPDTLLCLKFEVPCG